MCSGFRATAYTIQRGSSTAALVLPFNTVTLRDLVQQTVPRVQSTAPLTTWCTLSVEGSQSTRPTWVHGTLCSAGHSVVYPYPAVLLLGLLYLLAYAALYWSVAAVP